MSEVKEFSLHPEQNPIPIRFNPEPIGNVEICVLRKPGEPLIKWVDSESPKFQEGESFVVGFTPDLPLAVVTIGHLRDIGDPGITEWVQRTLESLEIQKEDSFSWLRCKVFRVVK